MSPSAKTDSSSAVCRLTVVDAVLQSDPVLHLVAQLASPLQLKIVRKKKNAVPLQLEMTASGENGVVLTQRNAILRALSGAALHGALDLAPYYFLAGGFSSNSSIAASGSMGSIIQWMSLADSLRNNNKDDGNWGDILQGLDEHLEVNSFLVPTSSQCTLADLDVAVVLWNHADELGGWASFPASVQRWLRQCHASMASYAADAGLPETFLQAIGPPPPVAPLKAPMFFFGNEDINQVMAQLHKNKTKKSAAGSAATDGPKAKKVSAQQQQDKNQKKKEDKQPKQGKKGKQKQEAQQQTASYDITALDIRVGKILKIWNHESSDKLFCEEVDLGNGEIRQIGSGLRAFYKAEELLNKTVLVLCNLKARKLAGFPSHGMILCASSADHSAVELIAPPAEAAPGDRVQFEGYDGTKDPEPENKIAKKKIFEKLAPDLKTNDKGQVVWKGAVAKLEAGVVVASKGMANASVS